MQPQDAPKPNTRKFQAYLDQTQQFVNAMSDMSKPSHPTLCLVPVQPICMLILTILGVVTSMPQSQIINVFAKLATSKLGWIKTTMSFAFLNVQQIQFNYQGNAIVKEGTLR